MDLGLDGKTAVVAAASRGLGKAAATALAREGARVAICSHSEQIHQAGKEIEAETGAEVLSAIADVTDRGQVDDFIEQSLDRFDGIDVLITNAAGPPPGRFLELEPADWQQAAELTLMSTVHLCYAVVPHMVEAGSGSIVASQSYTVKEPLENLILSNSLRMAVIGMMKTMANELGPLGVRVNSINPAWTMTERVEQLVADRASRSGQTTDEELAKLADTIPLGRIGTVEEYGKTIAWLASPAASFIHGHALMFDGGSASAAL